MRDWQVPERASTRTVMYECKKSLNKSHFGPIYLIKYGNSRSLTNQSELDTEGNGRVNAGKGKP